MCAPLHCGSLGEFFPLRCPLSLLWHLLLKDGARAGKGEGRKTAVLFPKQLRIATGEQTLQQVGFGLSGMRPEMPKRKKKKQIHFNLQQVSTVCRKTKAPFKNRTCYATRRDIVWHLANEQVWQVCYAIGSQTCFTPHCWLAAWLIAKLPKQSDATNTVTLENTPGVVSHSSTVNLPVTTLTLSEWNRLQSNVFLSIIIII